MEERMEINEGGKRILNTVQNELFPAIEKLRKILVDVQSFKTSFQLYSPELEKIDLEYTQTSAEFFIVATKLQTPSILFEGLSNDPQHMVDYFRFQGAFQQNINQGINYIEIIDRTLDRKQSNIQNYLTLIISILAIIISILWR